MDISAGMTVPVIFIITVLLAIPITTVRANVEVYGDDPSVLMAKSQAGLLGENDTFDCFAVGCSAGQFCECLEANLSLCSCVSEYNQSTTAVPSNNSRAAGTMPPSSSLKPACQVVPSTASGHARFQVVCELPVTHDQLALESLYYLEISTLRPEESRICVQKTRHGQCQASTVVQCPATVESFLSGIVVKGLRLPEDSAGRVIWSGHPTMNRELLADASSSPIDFIVMPSLQFVTSQWKWVEHLLRRIHHQRKEQIHSEGGVDQDQFSMMPLNIPSIFKQPLVSLRSWPAFQAIAAKTSSALELLHHIHPGLDTLNDLIFLADTMEANCNPNATRVIISITETPPDIPSDPGNFLAEFCRRISRCNGISIHTRFVSISPGSTVLSGVGFTAQGYLYINCTSSSMCVTDQLELKQYPHRPSLLDQLALLFEGSVWNSHAMYSTGGKHILRNAVVHYLMSEELAIRDATYLCNMSSIIHDVTFPTLPSYDKVVITNGANSSLSTVDLARTDDVSTHPVVLVAITLAVSTTAITLLVVVFLVYSPRSRHCTRRRGANAMCYRGGITYPQEETGPTGNDAVECSRDWPEARQNTVVHTSSDVGHDGPGVATDYTEHSPAVQDDDYSLAVPLRYDRPIARSVITPQNMNGYPQQSPSLRSQHATDRSDSGIGRYKIALSDEPSIDVPSPACTPGCQCSHHGGNSVTYYSTSSGLDSYSCTEASAASQRFVRCMSREDEQRYSSVPRLQEPSHDWCDFLKEPLQQMFYTLPLFGPNDHPFGDAIAAEHLAASGTIMPQYCGNRIVALEQSSEHLVNGFLVVIKPNNEDIKPHALETLTPLVYLDTVGLVAHPHLRVSHRLQCAVTEEMLATECLVVLKLCDRSETWRVYRQTPLPGTSLVNAAREIETEISDPGCYAVAGLPLCEDLNLFAVPTRRKALKPDKALVEITSNQDDNDGNHGGNKNNPGDKGDGDQATGRGGSELGGPSNDGSANGGAPLDGEGKAGGKKEDDRPPPSNGDGRNGGNGHGDGDAGRNQHRGTDFCLVISVYVYYKRPRKRVVRIAYTVLRLAGICNRDRDVTDGRHEHSDREELRQAHRLMKERRFRHVCDHVLHCVDIEGKLSIELDPTMVDSFVDFDSRNSRTPYLETLHIGNRGACAPGELCKEVDLRVVIEPPAPRREVVLNVFVKAVDSRGCSSDLQRNACTVFCIPEPDEIEEEVSNPRVCQQADAAHTAYICVHGHSTINNATLERRSELRGSCGQPHPVYLRSQRMCFEYLTQPAPADNNAALCIPVSPATLHEQPPGPSPAAEDPINPVQVLSGRQQNPDDGEADTAGNAVVDLEHAEDAAPVDEEGQPAPGIHANCFQPVLSDQHQEHAGVPVDLSGGNIDNLSDTDSAVVC